MGGRRRSRICREICAADRADTPRIAHRCREVTCKISSVNRNPRGEYPVDQGGRRRQCSTANGRDAGNLDLVVAETTTAKRSARGKEVHRRGPAASVVLLHERPDAHERGRTRTLHRALRDRVRSRSENHRIEASGRIERTAGILLECAAIQSDGRRRGNSVKVDSQRIQPGLIQKQRAEIDRDAARLPECAGTLERDLAASQDRAAGVAVHIGQHERAAAGFYEIDRIARR